VCLWLQFLPQDKVVMFARLTPTELLKETEKAIGSGELFELHKELTERKIAQMDTSHVRICLCGFYTYVFPISRGCLSCPRSSPS